VGKTAVARWDLRQKELKAQQQQEQQQEKLLQQQLPASTPGNEQYSFGHHGFADVRALQTKQLHYFCWRANVWLSILLLCCVVLCCAVRALLCCAVLF
jgi:hypothetical protein